MRTPFLVLAVSLAVVGAPLAATAPFEVSTGRPMVQLTVNGKGPYPFVLDHLGKAGLGMGVVGPSLFREHGPLDLDFKNNTVTIGDDAKPAGIKTWIPFGDSAPLLDVPVQIGELRIDGHIATGSPGVLAVPNRFQDQLPLSGPVRTLGMARTVDAEFEIRAAPVTTSARIADAEIPLGELHLAELPVANLGTAGLRGLDLFIDWEHERFGLTGTAEPMAAKAPSGPRFGVRARPDADGSIEVMGTDPGSPAEAIGLIPGDRIVAINGKSMASLPPDKVRAELADPHVTLTVERDGETISLKHTD